MTQTIITYNMTSLFLQKISNMPHIPIGTRMLRETTKHMQILELVLRSDRLQQLRYTLH